MKFSVTARDNTIKSDSSQLMNLKMKYSLGRIYLQWALNSSCICLAKDLSKGLRLKHRDKFFSSE